MQQKKSGLLGFCPPLFSLSSLPNTLALLTLFAVTTFSANREIGISELESLSLEELLNIEIQTGTFLDLKKNQLPYSITLIDKQMIFQSGAKNISELLEIYVPGLQVLHNKWTGTLWGMRGITPPRNQNIIYLVNGQKLNSQGRDGLNSELTLGLLSDIEKIEVIRGTAGLVYGSGALSGVVNIVTQKKATSHTEFTAGLSTDQGQLLEGALHNQLGPQTFLTFQGGVYKSQGEAPEAARIFGKGGWPYPGWIADSLQPKQGAKAENGFGYTPGNYLLAVNFDYKNFNLYTRFTRQIENPASWFIYDPWPEVTGEPDSTYSSKYIDGKLISPSDPFWIKTEAYRNNRRQYWVNNINSRLSYEKILEHLQYKLFAEVAKQESQIQIVSLRPEYLLLSAHESQNGPLETFGETRYTTGAQLGWGQPQKFQFLTGLEYRADHLGPDFNGNNMQDNNKKHFILTDVWYQTFSHYTEGIYYLNRYLNSLFGYRIDHHTRAFMFNPALTFTYTPHPLHQFKFLAHSSSNTGSADSYEYNREHVNNDGFIDTVLTFQSPSGPIDSSAALSLPSPTRETLHQLKPEQVYTLEVISDHQISTFLHLSPSLTYGWVRNLFIWSQKQRRMINADGYDYLNAELEVDLKWKMFASGFSHSYQIPINTNPDDYQEVLHLPLAAKDSTGNFITTQITRNGKVEYQPVIIPDSTDTVTINHIKSTITHDGNHFINLATHTSKAYLSVTPFPWLVLHSNVRVFWGLPGRKHMYKPLEKNGLEIFSIYQQGWNSAITKLNFTATIKHNSKTEIRLACNNVLAPWKSFNRSSAQQHSLRWQQSTSSDQSELTTDDIKSFSITLNRAF